MSDLPPWKCQSLRDERKMVKWVNAELNRMYIESNPYLDYGTSVLEADDDYKEQQAVAQAYRGNIEPLRQLYPHLAPFLHRPKQKRGIGFPRNNEGDPVRNAVTDVRRIRALWKASYGKTNRPKNDRVTAEQIAADRWNVDVEAVVNRLRKIPSK